MDPEVRRWEQRIKEPRKWLPNERYVTWVLPYYDMTLLVTKIHDVGGTMVTIEKSDQGTTLTRHWLKSHTPEALLEVLYREVPLVLIKSVQVS